MAPARASNEGAADQICLSPATRKNVVAGFRTRGSPLGAPAPSVAFANQITANLFQASARAERLVAGGSAVVAHDEAGDVHGLEVP